jgi:ABC-2 type transport system permease protein
MEESKPTAMIVVADGDIIRNQIDIKRKTPLPLGYDQYTQNTYANKEFIENAISYLVDGEGLIDIRSRELKVRLLDVTKINQERTKWQVINTLVPIALIIALGFVMAFVRKKKYSKQ